MKCTTMGRRWEDARRWLSPEVLGVEQAAVVVEDF